MRDGIHTDIETDYGERACVKDMKMAEEALKNRGFEMWLHPQYDHRNGRMTGSEALVRWRCEGGHISPEEFIPYFEKTKFISELDRYIWEEACCFLRRQLDAGRNPLPISVNVSRVDMLGDAFPGNIHELTAAYEIPKGLLRIEITESAFASHKDIIRKTKQLVDMGYIVEIDDFGSGYSSLNMLKDIPAHAIKLDLGFFDIKGDDGRSWAIVESVVGMARKLGMRVIAEGVESISQADRLEDLGCHEIQGYCYARPMPADEAEAIAYA